MTRARRRPSELATAWALPPPSGRGGRYPANSDSTVLSRGQSVAYGSYGSTNNPCSKTFSYTAPRDGWNGLGLVNIGAASSMQVS